MQMLWDSLMQYYNTRVHDANIKKIKNIYIQDGILNNGITFKVFQ